MKLQTRRWGGDFSLKVIRKLVRFHHMYKTNPHKSQLSNSGSNLLTNDPL